MVLFDSFHNSLREETTLVLDRGIITGQSLGGLLFVS